MSNNHKRRISLDEDFMNTKINDILYALMFSEATYNPTTETFYLSRTKVLQNKSYYIDVCNISRKTFDNHIKVLQEYGLIYLDDDSNYVFDYDYNSTYQWIDKDLLFYLATTRNKHTIKIYVYLLNKYLWKEQQNKKYNFTIKELLRVIGFKPNNNTAYRAVSNIIKSLEKEGFIQTEDIYYIDDTGRSPIPIPNKRLVFMLNHID